MQHVCESKHEKECMTNTPLIARVSIYLQIEAAYRKKYEIRKLMAYKNLTIGDAKKLIYKKT